MSIMTEWLRKLPTEAENILGEIPSIHIVVSQNKFNRIKKHLMEENMLLKPLTSEDGSIHLMGYIVITPRREL